MTQIDQLEQDYHEITELFQLADDLIMTTEHEAITDKEAQIDLVEPVVSAIVESADTLSEEFFVQVEDSKPARKKASKGRIENALRKMYMAISAYSQKATQLPETVKRITDPIVTRIKRQLEVVVATLVQFVQLSLDLIMQKHDVDELRKRQDRIANMLQHAAQVT
jgi:geranylgeranyl pyrophosphate synthase